eukprot:CAMPEP_0201946746 /NCGR_PEP_ID=MMETSP0903-20130614/54579_1 /ASSEMBLY_ACC=CAM_ASM_000552 /TAXON_ID=420261 /ORGANISM="Thalassiosira antarctica, Strain CCMP982" /LENGTH=397 /DNA_ID=CAMNT_0048489853 /DNA_START=47 /DNA_END=1241 /DNA_ORIENTATION=-
MILTSTFLQCRALSRIGPIASRSLNSAAAASSFPSCAQTQIHTHQTYQRQHQLYSTSSPSAASSTAQLVKQLRESTGAPMMECKKALSSPEVNNDIQLAQEWLRKHGTLKASSKVAGREALEGLVGIQITELENGKKVASLVKVASETDFASRSEVFSTFVQEVADAAAAAGTDGGDETDFASRSEVFSTFVQEVADAAAAAGTDSTASVDDIPNFLSTAKNNDGKLLSESLNDAILAIRENLQVSSISLLQSSSPNSVLAGYVHGRSSPNATCGSFASLVELEGTSDKDKEKAQEAAKKLAMHIVAAKPLYLNPDSVPESVVQKEKEILMEKMQGTNKPPEIMEKIITGQLRKFYEGICLTEQPHMVEEGNPKVSKFMKGLGLEVKAFRLMGMSKS